MIFRPLSSLLHDICLFFFAPGARQRSSGGCVGLLEAFYNTGTGAGGVARCPEADSEDVHQGRCSSFGYKRLPSQPCLHGYFGSL